MDRNRKKGSEGGKRKGEREELRCKKKKLERIIKCEMNRRICIKQG